MENKIKINIKAKYRFMCDGEFTITVNPENNEIVIEPNTPSFQYNGSDYKEEKAMECSKCGTPIFPPEYICPVCNF